MSRAGQGGAKGTTHRSRNRASTAIAVTAVVLGAGAAAWSTLATVLIVLTARITYYLPPPPGAPKATQHHDWNTPTLTLTAVSGLALLLALAGLVLGGAALVRRRGARARVLILPGAALLLATCAMVIATQVPVPTY